MKDSTLFARLIEESLLLSKIIKDRSFKDVDFNSFSFEYIWDEHYIFKNLNLGDYTFATVEVNISNGNIWIQMLTANTDFFETPLYFFDSEGIKVEIQPFQEGGKEIKELRRKITTLKIFDIHVRLSVYESSSYGCRIKLGFIF
jgi:hypothetical protein